MTAKKGSHRSACGPAGRFAQHPHPTWVSGLVLNVCSVTVYADGSFEEEQQQQLERVSFTCLNFTQRKP